MIAEIVKVEAPDSAQPGDTVIVYIHVKNLGLAPGGYNYILVGGLFDSTPLTWQFPTEPPSQFSDYLTVAPQDTVVFQGLFTMPSKSVRVTLNSYYWVDQWISDDYDHIDIAVSQQWVKMISNPVLLSVSISEPILLGWVKMISSPVTLAIKKYTITPTPPKPEVPPEEVKREIPWVPIALIGGGLAITVVSLTKPEK